MRKLIIAIDGPAASGKSTTARLVAEELGYLHIDTGAMYRAITLRVLEEGLSPSNQSAIQELAERTSIRLERQDGTNRVFLDGREVTDEIRFPEVTGLVSKVSSLQGVRDLLVREQRRIAAEGGVVLEGRDIGTVVLPHADLKIFMTADKKERARRRMKELSSSGVAVELSDLEKDIEQRDFLDSTREASPLKKAGDAIVLDTSTLSVEGQVSFIVKQARAIIEGLQRA